ncbi:hypothetical protein SDC9_53994 [bioreactor metagenome]|jgi:hypothetical protein|uniref:Uncharacterized protein n=1 Tax=bioreactor metagenome TaxID=1076179 RepID=A0A644WVI4_9ZZZZ
MLDNVIILLNKTAGFFVLQIFSIVVIYQTINIISKFNVRVFDEFSEG